MIFQSIGREKSLSAFHTVKRLLVGRRPEVNPVVVAYSTLGDESFSADRADERVEAGVPPQVRHESALLFEESTTFGAAVALLVRVGAEVGGQSTGVYV